MFLHNLTEFLFRAIYYLWFIPHVASGVFLYLLYRAFVYVKPRKRWRFLVLLTLGFSSGMVIWVGDNNLLFTLPVFCILCVYPTQGDLLGRIAVALVFFCNIMSICAILDTYLAFLCEDPMYGFLKTFLRPIWFGGMMFLLRKRLPENPPQLPHRLWRLVLGLSAMPLCSLAASVLLGSRYYKGSTAYILSMNMGLVILPFVFLTSVILMFTIVVLANHARLEQQERLSSLREIYYQGMRREEQQVRRMRHDMRNHLAAIRGLIMQGETDHALDYIDEIAGTDGLKVSRRFCENETANAVLAAKWDAIERTGLKGDFKVSLPSALPIADTDLAALLGNALDNAIEAAVKTPDKHITVRCRTDKGLFMLKVINSAPAPSTANLATSKADKTSHGFGIPGMREIAERYKGTLETVRQNGQFELAACLQINLT